MLEELDPRNHSRACARNRISPPVHGRNFAAEVALHHECNAPGIDILVSWFGVDGIRVPGASAAMLDVPKPVLET